METSRHSGSPAGELPQLAWRLYFIKHRRPREATLVSCKTLGIRMYYHVTYLISRGLFVSLSQAPSIKGCSHPTRDSFLPFAICGGRTPAWHLCRDRVRIAVLAFVPGSGCLTSNLFSSATALLGLMKLVSVRNLRG